MDCCKFEPKLQVDCVLSILKILRSGELLAARSELLQHAGCVIGCLGKYLEDSPQPVGDSDDAVELPSTLEECAAELTEAFQMSQGLSINPAMIALIMKLIELLIAKLS